MTRAPIILTCPYPECRLEFEESDAHHHRMFDCRHGDDWEPGGRPDDWESDDDWA